MITALALLASSVAHAQVPSDVVLVAGDPDAVDGYLDTGASWVGSPWLNGAGPASSSFIDLEVDANDDTFAAFTGSLDIWHYDDGLSLWVSVATIPGSVATDSIVSVEQMWDGHLMVATDVARTVYEVDPDLASVPPAPTVTSIAVFNQVNGPGDTLTNYQLIGSRGHATIGSAGTFSLAEYNFGTDTQSVLHTLPGEPTALHNFKNPRRYRFISIAGTPDDTLYAYDDATVLWSETLSGNVVDLDHAWDGALWGLYDDGTIWRIDGLDGGEIGTTALIASGLPANASTLFSGAKNATDVCRNNPYQFTAGSCGCDYMDVDIVPTGLACRYWTAELGTGVTLNDGVTIENGAVIGNNATVGADSLVAAGASIGASATLGTDVIVGRFAEVGPSVVVGSDVILGRSSEVAAGTVEAFAALGQDSRFGGGTLGTGTVLASGVELNGTWQVGTSGAGSMPVFGRDVNLVGGGTVERGVVVGPGVTSTGTLSLGAGSRVRKDVVFGTGDVVGAAVRIGRDASIADSVEIRANSVLRAQATLTANQCLVAGTVVDRADTVSGQTCP